MWRLDHRACATLALMALAGVGGIRSADARGEESREGHEHRPPERVQPQAHHAHSTRETGIQASPRREAAYSREHPPANYHRETGGHGIHEQRFADGGVVRETHLASGTRVREVSRGFGGGQVRVVRYGSTLSGTVEHTIRPGLVSRTFVGGGHVLYTRVYQRHVWYQSGRAFAYETFVPAVRYPTAYYAWALTAWPRPVTYTWGWQAQPWYPAYGVLFTPYPVYTSPDLWMTDYIIARNMQTAYQAQTAASGLQAPPPELPAEPAGDSSVVAPAGTVSSDSPAPAQQQGEASPAAQSGDAPSSRPAMPPALTPQVKAQLNAQIKVRLQEQESAAAMPATLTTANTPPALRPNHVFFQVVEPLDVPSGTANRYCSLSADDYIKRTGPMSNDDWTIPVVVELSGPSDCPKGLQTRIGLNDLNAMENEQEAQVIEAMQAASKSMGPNGPPRGPGIQPSLIADGRAAPDPKALDAIRQVQ